MFSVSSLSASIEWIVEDLCPTDCKAAPYRSDSLESTLIAWACLWIIAGALDGSVLDGVSDRKCFRQDGSWKVQVKVKFREQLLLEMEHLMINWVKTAV